VRLILNGAPVRLVTLDALSVRDEAVEEGSSTAENAELKARVYFGLTGIPTLAMDGGLRIARFAAEQQPGVLVRRQEGIGPEASEQDVLSYYRRALAAVGGESLGVWTGSHALALSAGQVVVESFTFEVRFTIEARNAPEPGLPLDPLIYTEMPVEERPYYRPIADFVRRWVLTDNWPASDGMNMRGS